MLRTITTITYPHTYTPLEQKNMKARDKNDVIIHYDFKRINFNSLSNWEWQKTTKNEKSYKNLKQKRKKNKRIKLTMAEHVREIYSKFYHSMRLSLPRGVCKADTYTTNVLKMQKSQRYMKMWNLFIQFFLSLCFS